MTDEFVSEEDFSAMKAEMADRLDAIAASQKSYIEATRTPSMALRIGSGPNPDQYDRDSHGDQMSFIKAVALARSHDTDEQAEGKRWLDTRSQFQRNEKAALGSAAATGGWIIPNDPVDDIVKPAVLSGPYTQLMTVIRGVNASGVDIPFRTAAPARAAVVAWGDQKPNVDLAYDGYTATMALAF